MCVCVCVCYINGTAVTNLLIRFEGQYIQYKT